MPMAQAALEHGPFRLDRFKPSIRGVETQNYNQRAGEIRDDFLQSLAQSTFLTIKYGLIDAERELDRISNMRADWDSYGAEPPSADAIQGSKGILEELATALILPSAIVPSAEGGVSIYFMAGNRTAYIETYNQGSQVLVMYDQLGNTDVLEIGSDIPLIDVSRRILAYLG